MVREQFKSTYEFLLNELNTRAIEYYLHELASQTAMIDIWYNKQFYVIQFEQHFIGYTEVKEGQEGKGTMPEMKFYDEEKFISKIKEVLK